MNMDSASYNEAVRQNSQLLLRYILKNLRNQLETAQDIVQNCFEALWNNKERIPAEKAKSYLFTVAHNQIIDIYRKSGRMVCVEEHFENDKKIEASKHMEQKQMVHLLLEILSPLAKSMVLLKDYEGYSYDEIAKITNQNVGQVKITLFRARKKMKERYELTYKTEKVI